jgi:hypothetical protein
MTECSTRIDSVSYLVDFDEDTPAVCPVWGEFISIGYTFVADCPPGCGSQGG